ncbi:hypothetical protein ACFE04_016431 [Oxalis oulophora]
MVLRRSNRLVGTGVASSSSSLPLPNGDDDDAIIPDSDEDEYVPTDDDGDEKGKRKRKRKISSDIDEESLGSDDEYFDSDDEEVALIDRVKKTFAGNAKKPNGLRIEEPLPDLQRAIDLSLQKQINKCKKKKSPSKKTKDEKPTLMWNVWEEEHGRWITEYLAANGDLDQQNEMMTETAEQPAEVIIPLLRYQKEWLAWALKQEDSSIKGGILADEMGMGKTIQAIALVLAKRGICQNMTGDHIKTTLVVCPVVAVSQWVNEINRFTAEGSTRILVYHGPNREKITTQFSDYDFVITTYSTIEVDYRKYMMPPKKKCEYCVRAYDENKMRTHLRYFCGPDAIRTQKQSKQEKKKVIALKQHDDKKEKAATKKPTVCDEEDEQNLSKGKSILHSVNWQRIILDEAHFIKDRRSNTAKAILSLESLYKWALSGTPLQNRVGELYSLVRFLRIVPFSFYFCKDCDCRTLDYSSFSQCSSCDHNGVRHFCWWNKYIATPIQTFGSDQSKRAMILLKHRILKSIVLRRTKKGRAADLALPPRTVILRRDNLDIKEADYYEALYSESQAQFNTYVQAGTVTNNYAHIFDLLTRLRQAVNHPYLVTCSKGAAERNGNTFNTDTAEQECGICHEPAEDPVVTSCCSHVFCKVCLINFASALGQVSCPSCSKPLTVDLTKDVKAVSQTKISIKGFKASSILNRIQLDDFQSSTKIEALREEIRNMIEKDGSAKAIVFSQFTSFLDIINYSLQKSEVNCVQLDGSMSLQARDAAIKKFTEDAECRIFLMSLKAGGVALNLTVFLMDPWWNPAVERQAQDRIHRIGQYKPIRITRFIIKGTVEERILKLQEKKELVFEGTVGGSAEALGKLTEADMRFLFVT